MEIKFERTGNSRSSKINWNVISDNEISIEEAVAIQISKGYHPNGYDFMHFSCERHDDGKFESAWFCYASCD